MENERIRILLVEDDSDDVWIMRGLLGDRWDGPFELVQVELLASGIKRCDEGDFDIILLDLSLPDSRGLETFFRMKAGIGDSVPIVVLSGYDDENTAVKAVKAGAQDYLVKGQTPGSLLTRAICYAIERRQAGERIEALNADL